MRARAAAAALALAAAGPAAAGGEPVPAALAAGSIRAFTVTPSGSGPQRLDVTPALVSASARGDLADLRLVDGAGREVPYLVVAPPEDAPRWARAARVRAIPPARTESGFEVDLGAVREVSALRLELAGSFLKRLRLEGSVDRARWVVLAPEATVFSLSPDAVPACDGCAPAGLERREVAFEPARVRFLRAVLDDRRTPRLGLPTAAEARLAAGAAPEGPRVAMEVVRRAGEPGVSRFALRLPGPHLPVRAIELSVEAPRLARPARVLEARLAGGRLAPVELGRATLLRTERDGVVVSALRVPVSAPEEVELELVVEDGDNPPLELAGARAELAPLPWLFLESPGGAPLQARLGDPARERPRYDLEALRPELPRLRPALARLEAADRPAAAPAVAPADGAAAGGPGAPLDRAAFSIARAIPAAPPGLAAVRVDAAVLARSPDLSDVRLAAPDGRQLPYLVERRPEPLVVALPAPVRVEPAPPEVGAGRTAWRLDLPEPAFADARLVLETPGRVFERTVELWALEDDPRARGPRRLSASAWRHADPDHPAPPLTVPLPPFRARALRVVLDDGDNAPLPLASARLLLPAWRLRFFHPGPALALLHGAPDLGPPRYDLALLAPRLREAPARELDLGPGPAGDAGGAPGRAGRAAFWIVLGTAVAALLALVARLVGRAGGP